MQLDPEEIEDFIERALEEDIGRGDLTTNVTIPEDAVFRASMVAREDIVVCGIDIAMQTFDMMVPDFNGESKAKDGEKVKKGDVVTLYMGIIPHTAMDMYTGVMDPLVSVMDKLQHVVDTGIGGSNSCCTRSMKCG